MLNLPLYGPGVIQIIGLDSSRTLIAMAAEHARTGQRAASFLESSAEAIPLDTGVVSGTFIMEHEGGERHELTAGAFNYVPAKTVHQACTKPNEDALLFITVDGAWDLDWVEELARILVRLLRDLDERIVIENAKQGNPASPVLLARVAELEAKLAATAAELERARADAERERTERLEERARADRLAGEVPDIVRKLAELTAASNARRPASLPPPSESPPHRSWWPFRRTG